LQLQKGAKINEHTVQKWIFINVLFFEFLVADNFILCHPAAERRDLCLGCLKDFSAPLRNDNIQGGCFAAGALPPNPKAGFNEKCGFVMLSEAKHLGANC
jgi:hypothetical protein